MKGIILAGGAGTRLYPASKPISKILLPVYDKPMIYYPLTTLLLAGIDDILIITNPDDLENFKKTLGNGSNIGVKFSYKVQEVPKGIADSFIIGEDFIDNQPTALVLGDNIFHGFGFSSMLKNVSTKIKQGQVGATVFGYQVKDPQRFGVVEFEKVSQCECSGNDKFLPLSTTQASCGSGAKIMRAVSIEEKPKNPKSHYAVTGLYFYDNKVCEYAKTLKPSARGELEITDLNNVYLKNQELEVEILGRGFAWLDTGTHESLLQASNFVQAMELNTDMKIACIEEVAWRMGFIDKARLKELARLYPENDYKDYLLRII